MNLPQETTYLGIDYGERRIGLAVSDPTGLVARSYKTVLVASVPDAVRQLDREIQSIAPVGIIVGYPVSPSGDTGGERCRMVDGFIEELEKIAHIPIYREDERHSSAEAAKLLGRKSFREKRRKTGRIDQAAAAIILQSWLDDNAISGS